MSTASASSFALDSIKLLSGFRGSKDIGHQLMTMSILADATPHNAKKQQESLANYLKRLSENY